MNILHVCSYLYPALAYGGPAKVVYDLALEQSKHHNITIFTSDVWDASRRIKSTEYVAPRKQFQVIYFRNVVNSLAFILRFFTAFGMVPAFLFSRHKFDLVHIHDVYILPQLMIGYLAMFFNIPVIVSPHGVLDPVRTTKKSLVKKILGLVSNPLLFRVSAVVATSKKEEYQLRKLGLERVFTVWNGVPLRKHAATQQFSHLKTKGKLLILYVGKLHSQKGLVELLNACTAFKTTVTLVLAGPDDGMLTTLRKIAKENQLDAEFVGLMNDNQKQELFSLADVFVYPSYSEGFSIAILEAMAQNLAVVITKGCNFDEVEDLKAGVVVDQQNLERELVGVIADLTAPNAKRRMVSMGKKAKKLITTKYSITSMAKSTEKIYRSTMYNS